MNSEKKVCSRRYNDGAAHTVRVKELPDGSKAVLCPSCGQPVTQHAINVISKKAQNNGK